MLATIPWSLNDRDLSGHVGTITLIKIVLLIVQHGCDNVTGGCDNVSRKRTIRRLDKFKMSLRFLRKI